MEEERKTTTGGDPGVYFSVEVYQKDPSTFVAFCPELDIYSYGRNVEIAVTRLKKVVGFYLESAEEMGMTLEELGLATGSSEEAVPRVSSVNIKAAVN
ncbi:MAG: hypothetical protein D6679_09700 [Candidatus Hydrogenedentota bacterium]|nr:MAG: hypothetical protein D6679_09700 [Candidatus Hydrogenedentota bacterium]